MTEESYLNHKLTKTMVLPLAAICAGFVLTIVLFFATTGSAIADAYSELSATDKAYIDTQCLPIQYKEGAAAFRQCVIEQTESLSAVQNSAQTSLSFDEQFAVQQFCQSVGNPGSEAHENCANDQINSLQGVPDTDFSQVADDEIYALQQGCYSIQTRAGVRAYRECVNTALGALAEIPRPDLSTLSLLDKNALQLRCSALHDEAASYRSCLLEAMDGAVAPTTAAGSDDVVDDTAALDTASSATETAPLTNAEAAVSTSPLPDTTATEIASPEPVEVPTSAVEPVTNAAPDTDEPTSLPIEQPLPENTIASSEPDDTVIDQLIPVADSQAVTLESSTDTDNVVEGSDAGSILDKARNAGSSMWAQLQASAASLSNMGKLIMLAALALPLCLVGFWLLMRGRQTETPYEPAPYPNPLIDRVGPSQQRRERDVDYDSMASGLDTPDYAEQVDELFAQDNSTRLVKPDVAPVPTTVRHQAVTKAPDRGRISSWLVEQEPAQQLSLAIEFMIYWTAYADERYEPGLRQTIFALKDPDQHELIKRWVLKQDTQAFAEITSWLQSRTTADQREQILNLLMALLVNENAMTPAQNTLLRFLGDAFGAGNEKLDALYREAFGHPMPELPRTDKPLWWQQQAADDLKRWDARTVSRQSNDLQYRVRLGLPLTEALEEQQILTHFQRAVDRCNPQKLDLLTHRERMLVDRQLEKFEQAKNGLMEAFV